MIVRNSNSDGSDGVDVNVIKLWYFLEHVLCYNYFLQPRALKAAKQLDGDAASSVDEEQEDGDLDVNVLDEDGDDDQSVNSAQSHKLKVGVSAVQRKRETHVVSFTQLRLTVDSFWQITQTRFV